MESDTSLILLDESSSFQLLEKSESFVLVNTQPFENLELEEKFDAEDEWLQLETGSVISSMSLILKPDGSIQSEYSILDNMHASALNEGCKLIKTRPDIFVEDQTMRKILEYISMFSDEVAACLKLSRSAQSLVSSQKIQEDWEISSLVDLDDISVEALGLLLDTLEEFGMYKLCLIVCNRYSLGNRIGRYIVALASRYSFLNESQVIDVKGGAVVQKAAVAYTAVHNMLEMISPVYLSLKEKDGKDLGIEAFQGLLLLGYWKKLVYIMDFKNSMAVTSSFGDFKNYKQAYLIRNKNSDYDLSKEDFLWVDDQKDEENMILALDSVVWNFNGFLGVGHNKTMLGYTKGDFPQFPECFKYNKMVWEFVLKIKSFDEFKEGFIDYLSSSEEYINRPELFDKMQRYDFNSCFIQVIYLADEPNFVQLFNSLSFQEFESFLKIFSYACQVLIRKSQQISPSNLFGLLGPLGVRKIVESEVTAVYPFLTHALVHRSSKFIHQFSEIPKGAVVPDLEAHFYMIPVSALQSNLLGIIKRKLQMILKFRLNFVLEAGGRDIQIRGNLFGEVWMFDFIKNLETFKQHQLLSYNYLMLDKNSMKEYKEIQSKYKDLIQLGESDYYSEIYLKMTKGALIKKLERRLKQIENLNNNKNNILNESAVLRIVKLAELTTNIPDLTKTGQLALMTLAQIYIMNSENATESVTFKYLWISFHLYKVIKKVDHFLEVIRNHTKQSIKSGKKYSKFSSVYKVALGFADIDAYISRNNFYEAYDTIIRIFEYNFVIIDVEISVSLLYRAVVCWVISNVSYFETSSKVKDLIPSCVFNKGVNEIPEAVHKSFSPKTLLVYFLMIIRDLNLNELTASAKSILYSTLYECLYLILKYCGSNDEIHSIISLHENVLLLNIAVSQSPDSKLQDFTDISTQKIETFQKNYRSPYRDEYIVSKHANENEVYMKLENDWNKEQTKIASHIIASRKIKKFIKSKFAKKNFEALHESNQFYFASPSGRSLLPFVHTMNMELNEFYYRVHMKKVLDYHHLFNKYLYLAHLYRLCKNIEQETAEKYIQEVSEELENFRAWRKVITPEIENPKAAHKKKYKMRWPMKFKYAKRKR